MAPFSQLLQEAWQNGYTRGRVEQNDRIAQLEDLVAKLRDSVKWEKGLTYE